MTILKKLICTYSLRKICKRLLSTEGTEAVVLGPVIEIVCKRKFYKYIVIVFGKI